MTTDEYQSAVKRANELWAEITATPVGQAFSDLLDQIMEYEENQSKHLTTEEE